MHTTAAYTPTGRTPQRHLASRISHLVTSHLMQPPAPPLIAGGIATLPSFLSKTRSVYRAGVVEEMAPMMAAGDEGTHARYRGREVGGLHVTPLLLPG